MMIISQHRLLILWGLFYLQVLRSVKCYRRKVANCRKSGWFEKHCRSTVLFNLFI